MDNIIARYPSGRTLACTGKLIVTDLPDQQGVAPVVDDGKTIVVLDPRAMVTVNGELVYHPRAFFERLAPWVREYLRGNQQWDVEC